MAPAVEARSLCTVLNLADDPPANPRDGPLQDQLTLYIARVPGSRDIFLNTMKPLQKVVTAPDVESCLYYVHLDNAHDEKLFGVASSIGADYDSLDNIAGQPMQNHTVENSKRKPVLASPQPVVQTPLEPSTDANSHAQRPLQDTGHSMKPNPRATQLSGPRPMQSRLHTTPNSAMESTIGVLHLEQDALRRSEQPSLRPRGSQSQPVSGPSDLDALSSGAAAERSGIDRETNFENTPAKAAGLAQFSQDQTSLSSESGDFSLTLIRRYNGLQSNVGKIVHQSEYNAGKYDHSRSKDQSMLKTSEGISTITVFTPGYSKFVHETMGQEDDQSTRARSPRQSTLSSPVFRDENAHPPVRPFQRQLQTLRKRPQQQSRSELKHPYRDKPRLRSSLDLGGGNLQSSEALNINMQSPSLSAGSASDARGFAFESPWHGRCEFSTGVAGRSLKCKHTFNSISDSISELRFNLPSSKAFAPRSQSSSEPARDLKRSSIFSHYGRAHSSSEYPKHEGRVELEDRLDLSLGQERAGGGFGGKQAKLGKLIIENEGLKMLDLIVAANLALWWKVYERAA